MFIWRASVVGTVIMTSCVARKPLLQYDHYLVVKVLIREAGYLTYSVTRYLFLKGSKGLEMPLMLSPELLSKSCVRNMKFERAIAWLTFGHFSV